MNYNKYFISLIIPCYNEAESIVLLYNELLSITTQMSDYSFEFIFINDGSTDGTLTELKNLAKTDDRVIYISFSRNFGKEAALYAGLCNAKGDYIAVMDADMQDPPSLLPEMTDILSRGEYDVVAARRDDREGEPVLRSFFAKKFYKLINMMSDVPIVDGARDFRLMKRDVTEAIIEMSEYNRFSKGIFSWVGYNTYWISYKNIERTTGTSKWSFWALFKYSIDGIIGFSQVPLSIVSIGGALFLFISMLLIIFIVFRRIVFGDPVAGWASLVCLIIFLGGLQLFCTGIIGQYLSKAYLEVKNRPHYIVKSSNREDCKRIN